MINSASTPQLSSDDKNQYPSLQETFSATNLQQAYPPQSNSMQNLSPNYGVQQPNQYLHEYIDKVQQQNNDIQTELKQQEDKIEIIERQMMVFFGKMDRYIQIYSQTPNQNMQMNSQSQQAQQPAQTGWGFSRA